MEEIFEVKFANTEQEFIHNSGVNKGYTQVPHKITNSYLLNHSEKYLYSLIYSFMYGDKRTCYPSQEKLMAYSGWSKNTLKKHVEVLESYGLIKYHVRPGTTNKYEIGELHKSTIIVHSELLHQIRQEKFKSVETKFHSLLVAYKSSELYRTVSDSINPLKYYEEIENWFLTDGAIEIEVGPDKAETKPKRTLPYVPRHIDGIQRVSDLDKTEKKKKKKSNNFNELPINEWNCNHFYNYFEKLYQEKMSFALPSQQGDRAQLKGLIARYNSEKLKERIELFFNSDSFSSLQRKNIYTFSSGNVQAKLDKILNFGDSTSYKARGRQSVSHDNEIEKWMKETGITEE